MSAPTFLRCVDALLLSLDMDENHSGGLLSRDSLRRAGELRQLLARECHGRPGVLDEAPPPPRRDDGRAPL